MKRFFIVTISLLLSLSCAQQGTIISPNSVSLQPNVNYNQQPGYTQQPAQTGYNQPGYNQTAGYSQTAGYNQTGYNQTGYTGTTAASTATPTISASPDLVSSLAQFQYMLTLLEQRIASLESQNSQLQQRVGQLETKVNNASTTTGNTSGSTTGGTTGSTTGSTGGASSLNPSMSYYLQVGAFGRSDLASQQKLRLQQYGYNVYESYDGRLTRLYVGPYPGAQVANIQTQLLSQGYSSFPVQ